MTESTALRNRYRLFGAMDRTEIPEWPIAMPEEVLVMDTSKALQDPVFVNCRRHSLPIQSSEDCSQYRSMTWLFGVVLVVGHMSI